MTKTAASNTTVASQLLGASALRVILSKPHIRNGVVRFHAGMVGILLNFHAPPESEDSNDRQLGMEACLEGSKTSWN